MYIALRRLKIDTTDEDGKPLEIFVKHGKAGVCSQAQCEAIGRLASLALRSDVDPREIGKQLAGITCHAPFGFGPDKVLSCADAIARAMRLDLADEGSGARTDIAPPGQATVVFCPRSESQTRGQGAGTHRGRYGPSASRAGAV